MSWILEKDKAVGVRMYCQGFGDCFLLNIAGESPYYVLIDCGLNRGAKNEKEKLREVIESLLVETGGTIDLLIMTHEHYDHLAGFVHHKDLWRQFTVHDVWMGWTENEDDPLAQKLDKYKDKAVALALAGSQRMAFGGEQKALTDHLLGLLGAGGDLVRDARNFIKSLSATGAQYLIPGVVEPLGETGVSAAVLGPPTNEKLLHKTEDPNEMFPQMARNVALASASLGFDPPTSGDYLQTLRQKLGLPVNGKKSDLNAPFSPMYRFPLDDPRWKQLEYGEEIVVQEYQDLKNRYRRIDNDWANGAGELAMKLDSLTNNTNLSLAFRLPDGRVLLFAGDAQIGNWESWSENTYRFNCELTIDDLLQNTIFYKVGHHASHNATMKSAFMKMPLNVVSMVPVEPISQWKHIPLPSLLSELKSKGPTVRADESNLAQAPFVQGPQSPITKRPLWVQFKA